MARVLVTGGAGFIGSHIVDRFVAAGDDVLVIDDLSSGVVSNINEKARFLEADVTTSACSEAILEFKPELVVHAAAQMSVRISMERPTFDTRVNLVGLVNILEACNHLAQRGVAKPYFAFLSTGGAMYGDQPNLPSKELDNAVPTSVYGLAKRCSELYLDLWSRQFDLKYVALRLGNVYGPRQSPHGEAGVVAIFCQKLLRGERPIINGSGEQTRDFVSVSDVANAVELAVRARVSGVFNVGTGMESSVNQIYKSIATAMLKISGITEATRAAVSEGPLYGEAKPGEQLRSSISSELAGKVFGFKPQIPLDAGIGQTAQWFFEQPS